LLFGDGVDQMALILKPTNLGSGKLKDDYEGQEVDWSDNASPTSATRPAVVLDDHSKGAATST
jgi:hypothetical protein